MKENETRSNLQKGLREWESDTDVSKHFGILLYLDAGDLIQFVYWTDYGPTAMVLASRKSPGMGIGVWPVLNRWELVASHAHEISHGAHIAWRRTAFLQSRCPFF